MRKIVVLVLFFLVFSAGTSFAAEKFFEVKAKKFSYTPNIIRVNKGDLVKIRLISEDVQHGFFLDGYEVETSAYPGQDGSIRFVADTAGKFNFRCSVTCGEFHPYMIGYMVVGPNTRFYGFLAAILILGLTGLTIVIFKNRGGNRG